MSVEALAPYLAGPGAAVLVLLLVGAGVYRLVVTWVLPAAQSVVARHMTELENANQRHEDAVARHMDHISTMGNRYDSLASQHAEQHRNILQAVERMHEACADQMERTERKVGGLYARLDSLKDASLSEAS